MPELLRPDRSQGQRSLASLPFRAEDWLLAGFVALLTPALAAVEGVAGPFDADRPLQGLLRLIGACGAMACLASRNSDRPAEDHPILTEATAGPLIGGIALVGASGLAGLGLPPEPALGLVFIGALVLSPFEGHLPAIPAAVRRNLVAPFLLAAGGIFWSLVDSVAGETRVGDQVGGAPEILALTLVILVVASAIFYAMLIYAPRQIVEREGSPVQWMGRYAFFVACVAFGVSWLAVVGL
jgi:hypothetical protein